MPKIEIGFSIIAMLTPVTIVPGVPTHGEVCPGTWIFHRIEMSNLAAGAVGVRFDVHVHQGDVYYLLSRWDQTPGFAACNANEVPMTTVKHAHVDLCGYDGQFRTGYVGLYGGRSCAHYTVNAQPIAEGDECSTTTTSTCTNGT